MWVIINILLQSDISDINQIFKELGALVHEQGEVIDSIEASVETTENYVSQGLQQVIQAGSYKNTVRKRKVCLAVVGAVVLAVIIIIIVVSSR